MGVYFARQKDLLLQEASYQNAPQFCEGGSAFCAGSLGGGGNGVDWDSKVLDSLIPE